MNTRQVIGISGRAGHGKSTVCSYMKHDLSIRTGRPVREHAFGHMLKKVCRLMFRLNESDVETQEGKQKAQKHIGGLTARTVLQRFGTEIGRVMIPRIFPEFDTLADRSIWIWHVLQDISEHDDHVIVPDVRFPDEAAAVSAIGGTLVRVVRPGFVGYGENQSHASEAMIDNLPSDYIIINNSDLAALQKRTEFVLSEILAARK